MVSCTQINTPFSLRGDQTAAVESFNENAVRQLKINFFMKTLIAYYSFTHNNEVLAKDLQKKLNCDIHKIEEPGKRTGFTILLDLIFNRNPEILD